jgi:phenylalanyl-tRNA synthetase beta chain
VAIFESGTVYRAADGNGTSDGNEALDGKARSLGGHAPGGRTPVEEHHALGALLTGALGGWASRSWRGEQIEADFFAAKALLGALLDKFHVDWSVRPADAWPFLHPGRSAEVLAVGRGGGSAKSDPERLGFVGEVHPLVAAEWDLERTAVFAIDVGKLAAAAPSVVAFEAFASVPSLRQDLAVVLPEEMPAAQVLASVEKAGGEVLDDVSVFDVYAGPQVGEGKRSLALALSFRAADRTLTEEDVAPVRAKIVAALGELGGELRG